MIEVPRCSALGLMVAAAAIGTGDMLAQERPTSVPVELARALLTGSYRGADLFVGARLPEVLQGAPLGADGLVVGGLALPDGGVVVVEVAASPREALDRHEAHLAERGWERPRGFMADRGGFRSSTRRPWSIWCSAGYWVQSTAAVIETTTYLNVRYSSEGGDPSPCADDPRRRPPFPTFRFPDLEPPPGASVEPRGGGGNSGSMETSAIVETDMGAPEVFEHYARQLSAAGWTPRGQASGAEVGVASWDLQDDDGNPLVGLLTIWGTADEGQWRVVVRMDRPDGVR